MTPPRTTKGLVGRRGDHVTVRKRVIEQPGRNEARRVRDVRQEDGADFIGDLSKASVVPFAGVGGGAANDHLRFLTTGGFRHLVHVNATRLLFHAVKCRAVEFAAVIDRRAVGEVAAVCQVKPEDRVPRLQAREHNRGVG